MLSTIGSLSDLTIESLQIKRKIKLLVLLKIKLEYKYMIQEIIIKCKFLGLAKIMDINLQR